ncbi:hypothetical protein SGF_03494 [Shigella flexneri CDC 796-83]|uniref:Uncharacterized protein n=1 Tax=Shigella flexneri CDC 796-83 TaxID=945360 RepID=A0A6N3QJJ0_SHIFL|nr:hypothetical protein SGF_03494 [Shigella flexneri CDC 796-83]
MQYRIRQVLLVCFLVCLPYLQFYFVFLFTGDSERKQQHLSRPFQGWFRENGILMKLSMPL